LNSACSAFREARLSLQQLVTIRAHRRDNQQTRPARRRRDRRREQVEERGRLGAAVRVEQLLGLVERQNDRRLGCGCVDRDQPPTGQTGKLVEQAREGRNAPVERISEMPRRARCAKSLEGSRKGHGETAAPADDRTLRPDHRQRQEIGIVA